MWIYTNILDGPAASIFMFLANGMIFLLIPNYIVSHTINTQYNKNPRSHIHYMHSFSLFGKILMQNVFNFVYDSRVMPNFPGDGLGKNSFVSG